MSVIRRKFGHGLPGLFVVSNGTPIIRTESVDTPVIVQLVNRLIANAIIEHADRIEIIPEPAGTHIYYFIGGIRHTAQLTYPRNLSKPATGEESFQVPAYIHATVMRRLKAMAEIKYYDQTYPQAGSIQVTISDVRYHLQVTIDQSVHGETATIDISPMGHKEAE